MNTIHTELYESDGLSVEAYVIRKPNIKYKQCIIYVRGGNNHPSQEYKLEIDKNEMKDFLPFNTLVIATNFRGSKNSDGTDEMGGADLNDIMNLYTIVKKYCVKSPSIVMIGWSIGGMKTLQVLANYKKLIKKKENNLIQYVTHCVLIAPVTDLLSMKRLDFKSM